ncbi:glycerol-3-phosphate acyltransferase, chloroplastic isoform X1 [Daucus carota subsp. sativus]|uniref:glycerol-3-phosphate acyltransferase, chloroplastic isoform X1 n=1 Tax=Daucus carota subsp. sativus TaxID=79200 RepID=UPI0007EFCB09|nr:PREDICTED: glycerol-3-phosphate acyltransferase, chloroplastic-like [Daucus carota subsp. sativus]
MTIQIHSTSPSPTLLSLKLTRFSYLPPAPTRCYSLRSSFRRHSSLAVVLCSSQVPRGVVESGADTQASPSTSLSMSRTFLDARSGEELLSEIRREKDAGKLPSNVALGMAELYKNYNEAVLQSGDPKAADIVLSNMATVLNRIFMVVKDTFVFSAYHKAIREPFDYYMFAQDYIRPLINFRDSYVGNISVFNEMEEKLRQGDNVILISNHQTEADPAVIALLLESTNPYIGEGVTYIAGDRVVTDPLCKPFSMGRNLLCVYSKKHMNDDPELVDMKRRANTRSLKEMAKLLRSESEIIWIAPSGGRDRPDPVTNEWLPAPFDASAVDNMRRLMEHAGHPAHIYPVALLCHNIMPPPVKVEKEIGERRMIAFHGTGLSIAPPINYDKICDDCANPEEAKVAYSQALYDSVNQQYNVLRSAIHGKHGLEASTAAISLSQPWQ